MDPAPPAAEASQPGAADPARPGRAALVALGVMLLTLLPFLLGRAWAGPEEEFLWTRPVNAYDLKGNLAWIERARGGEHPLQNPFQPLPGAGLVRPTYQLLGGLGALTGLSGLACFHVGRIALGSLFLLAFYRLAAALFAREAQRWWAFVLCAGGSGLSWLAWLLRPEDPGAGWGDVGQVELTVSSSLLESPHLLLGHWLLAEAVLALALCARAPAGAPARGYMGRAGLAALFLVPDQPFLVPTLLLAAGSLAVFARGPGCDPRRLLAAGAAVGVGLALPAADLLLRLRSDAGFAAWSRGLETVGAGYLLLGLAPLWLLAALGAQEGPAWRTRALLAWALGVWLLVALPLPQQRRLAEGWVLPLALLGAQGIDALRARWPGRAAAPLALGLACLGSAHLVAVQVWEYRHPQRRAAHYAPRALPALLRGLRGLLGPDDVVLCDWRTSEWVPALAGCRVVHGHPSQGAAPPGRIEAAAAELQRAAAEGRAPRFAGALQRVRAVVARRGPDGRLRLALDRARLEAGELEPVWEGPVAWAEPALEEGGWAVVLVP